MGKSKLEKNNEKEYQFISNLIANYIDRARKELDERWSLWKIDLEKSEVHETLGALLARQVTLATQIALSPGTWNEHIAPVLLRAMVDVYISLAWVLDDPLKRSKKFVLYGLGQNKLDIEHRKPRLKEGDEDSENAILIKALEAWANSQRYTFLTEVELGSWSGINTRQMAEEADCIDFYNYVYTPFSAATHSMWHHISRYNLQTCTNPLHGYHRIPIDPDIEPSVHYFYLAAKYLQKTFKTFDSKTELKPKSESAFDYLINQHKSESQSQGQK